MFCILHISVKYHLLCLKSLNSIYNVYDILLFIEYKINIDKKKSILNSVYTFNIEVTIIWYKWKKEL